jgi:DNA segregation ATPase FtsK/SpoIIIE, S-DNA-T family
MPRKPSPDEMPPADSPLAPKPRRTRVRKDDAAEPLMPTRTLSRTTRSAGPADDEPQAQVVAAAARKRFVFRETSGIALLLGALFVAGALIFGRTPLATESCAAAGGAFGPVGGCIRWSVLGLVGALAAVVVPLIPAVHGLRLLGRLEESEDQRFLVFTIGLAVIIPMAAGLARLGNIPAGTPDLLAGLWGSFAAYYVTGVLGYAGAWIVVAIAFSALAAVTIGWNPVRVLLSVGRRDEVKREENAPSVITRAEELEPDASEMPSVDLSLMGLDKKSRASGTAAASANSAAEREPERESEPFVTLVDDDPAKEQLPLKSLAKKSAGRGKGGAGDDASASVASGSTASSRAAGAAGMSDDAALEQEHVLPSPELLTQAPARNEEAGRAQLDAMGAKLIESLKTFKVEGTLTGRTSGPTVTQYEIEPGPGVKVRQFANLANDLALAMRAPSIRVVAPIPGKGAVGVEVPNPNPEMVAFRDMLESRDYQNKPMALPIGLGKDLEGRPVIADLAKMPHLLIAGATGSGKSVCVNTIITSLIYRHTPKTLRFLMVDPKMVELSVYNVLPHLRHKVVTDNRDAAAVLKWAVLEMQERYALLAENGARNIQDFNTKVREGSALKKPRDPNVGFEDREYKGGVLPYIVVVIDELADLMMTVAAEVETPLAMLAQKARAIGIHLILATQRPSVNVITGLIKANFPSRIAFRVASQIDSRTIIDGMGAESLLGNGDMLFIPPGKSEPSRLQGAFLSNEDTERLMAWYTDRKEARKAAMEAEGLIATDELASEEDILARVKALEALEAGGGEESSDEVGDRDKLFREAAETCIQHQGGSTSLLQRRLKVGYGRAARIIDQLHLAGILGPPDGSKPRDVLVGLEDLDRIAGDRTAA